MKNLFSIFVLLFLFVLLLYCGKKNNSTEEVKDASTNEIYKSEAGLNEIEELSKSTIGYTPSKAQLAMAKDVLTATDANITQIAEAIRKEKYEFMRLTAGLDSTDRFSVLLLFFGKQPVNRGLTDDGLKYKAQSSVKKDIENIFSSKSMQECISVLTNISPKNLSNLLSLLAKPYFVGYNPHSSLPTTWAADSYEQVVFDITRTEIARHSIVLKLLVFNKNITLPKATYAEFRWSGMPSIKIYLSTVQLSKNNIPKLRDIIANTKYEYYSTLAKKGIDFLDRDKD